MQDNDYWTIEDVTVRSSLLVTAPLSCLFDEFHHICIYLWMLTCGFIIHLKLAFYATIMAFPEFNKLIKEFNINVTLTEQA